MEHAHIIIINISRDIFLYERTNEFYEIAAANSGRGI